MFCNKCINLMYYRKKYKIIFDIILLFILIGIRLLYGGVLYILIFCCLFDRYLLKFGIDVIDLNIMCIFLVYMLIFYMI